MKKISGEDFPIVRAEARRDELIQQFEKSGDKYKVEIIQGFAADAVVTTYSQGEFTDLCRGPHVARSVAEMDLR